MPTLDCPVRYRILDGPKEYGPLADFSCGKGGKKYEREINRNVARMFSGSLPPEEGMVVVILEKTVGGDHFGRPPLIGVCGLTHLQAEGIPGIPNKTFLPFVGSVGIDEAYRGYYLEDGATRCGSALLMSAMIVGKTMVGGGDMPAMLAKVEPTNKPAMTMFRLHGFDRLKSDGGYSVMLRPPDLDPDYRRVS